MKNAKHISPSVKNSSSEATFIRSQDNLGWKDLRRPLVQTYAQNVLKNPLN